MTYWTLCGYDTFDEPHIYAINIPTDDRDEIETKAEEDGWTGLVWTQKMTSVTPSPEPSTDSGPTPPPSPSPANSGKRSRHRPTPPGR